MTVQIGEIMLTEFLGISSITSLLSVPERPTLQVPTFLQLLKVVLPLVASSQVVCSKLPSLVWFLWASSPV